MEVVEPILTGKYMRSGTREAPSKELMQSMGMPMNLPESEKAAQEEQANG